jgi:hypothetical protein
MRTSLPSRLEKCRIREGTWGSDSSYGVMGAFLITGPENVNLKIISCDARFPESEGWEHVSVSTEDRCPTWKEMCFVKDLFWDSHECVIQFHPPLKEYVNYHPNCLHLWGYALSEIPTPPSILVGPKK